MIPTWTLTHIWSRERLCGTLGLDSRRPILVFATLGQFKKFIDETDSFQALLDEIDSGRIPGRPQVVLRLHPVSREQYWEVFRAREDVVVSRYLGYSPGMRWWPSQDEVALAGNLLRHADVCLSPGSTMAIEPAIFDTPAIVPIFNRYMPEEYERFFDAFWMSRHFGFLAENELLPFVRSAGEMTEAVCRALADRSWMKQERSVIREELIGPLDGHSTERLAQVAVRAANGSKAWVIGTRPFPTHSCRLEPRSDRGSRSGRARSFEPACESVIGRASGRTPWSAMHLW